MSPTFDELREEGMCATVVTFYAALYPRLRQAAYEVGYALALHGSLAKDLDVVAIPWVEGAASEEDLVRALVEASSGFMTTDDVAGPPKPHGRRCWVIHLGKDGGYIDLAVMPRGKP